MAQLELLWAAAALMLFGAAVSLCVKCQLSATKRQKQISERRSQLESQQRFEVIRSYSTTTRRLEQIKEPEQLARKTTKELGTSRRTGYGSATEPRYQNFLTEDCLQGDAAYVEPISLDYYNCARFFTPPNEKEEDSQSYQNVIVGVSHGSDMVTDDAVDYENSAAIHIWKLQQAEALQRESPDDEPDYINAAPASGPAFLSKQRNLKPFQSSFRQRCYVLRTGTPKTPLVCAARRLSSVRDSLGSAEPCLLCYNRISCPVISSNLMLMIKNYSRQLK